MQLENFKQSNNYEGQTCLDHRVTSTHKYKRFHEELITQGKNNILLKSKLLTDR